MEPQRLCWERQSQALQGGTNRPEMLFKSLCSLGISLHLPIPWPGISFGGVATQTFSFWRKMTVFVIRLSARGTLNWSGFGDRVSENSQLPIASVLYCQKVPLYEYTNFLFLECRVIFLISGPAGKASHRPIFWHGSPPRGHGQGWMRKFFINFRLPLPVTFLRRVLALSPNCGISK